MDQKLVFLFFFFFLMAFLEGLILGTIYFFFFKIFFLGSLSKTTLGEDHIITTFHEAF